MLKHLANRKPVALFTGNFARNLQYTLYVYTKLSARRLPPPLSFVIFHKHRQSIVLYVKPFFIKMTVPYNDKTCLSIGHTHTPKSTMNRRCAQFLKGLYNSVRLEKLVSFSISLRCSLLSTPNCPIHQRRGNIGYCAVPLRVAKHQ